MEALVLFLAMFSAWPFGSVHAYFQWILLIAIACLLACWAGRSLLEGGRLWTPGPIALALLMMCVLGVVQVVPMDAAWVRFLSPEKARLDETLLSADEVEGGSATLSVSPGDTRRMLLQLLAAVAVFCAVRANLREPASFRRLAWLSAGNGVLLSVIGLGQMVSTAPDTVFWSIPTQGQVFGPFICRNHFAFYVNLCVGLTAGLLLGTRCFVPETPLQKPTWRELLRDSRVLWLTTALGIVLAGLMGCLSRGGFIGLLLGGLAGLLILPPKGAVRWTAWALVPAIAGALILWMGHDRISKRWETLLDDNTRSEARAVVWARTLPLVGQFPIFGSGLGSFGLVEPATREPGAPFDIYHDHAHNDFLELWIEGGTGQIILAALAIALILFKGVRAVRMQPMSPNGRLALGGVIGLIAIVAQSFVDFGLHVPAVSLFTAIVAAMTVNMAEHAEPASGPAPQLPAAVRWPACLLQCAALMLLALFFIEHGRNQEQAERFRLASLRAAEDRRLDYLQAALAHAPERADLHLARAETLVQQWHKERAWQQMLCASALVGSGPAPNLPAAFWIGQPAPHGWDADPRLVQAQHHIAQARRLSPLHLVALEKTSLLAIIKGDDAGAARALARLRRLSPSEPGGWFWAGQEALKRGDRAAMCEFWKQALLRSDRFLPLITRNVPEHLSAAQLLTDALPANAALIMKALEELNARNAGPDDDTPYLKAALAALEAPNQLLDAEDLLLKARIHVRLGDTAAACTAYAAALAQNANVSWRLEFCRYLERSGLYQQAGQELWVLLRQDPRNPGALALQQEIYLKIAETKR